MFTSRSQHNLQTGVRTHKIKERFMLLLSSFFLELHQLIRAFRWTSSRHHNLHTRKYAQRVRALVILQFHGSFFFSFILKLMRMRRFTLVSASKQRHSVRMRMMARIFRPRTSSVHLLPNLTSTLHSALSSRSDHLQTRKHDC